LRYVLDASVAVAALRNTEPFHAEALRRCMPLFAGRDEIVVPAIFDVEVASALLRRGTAAATVRSFFARHFTQRTLVTIGPRAIRAVGDIVEKTRLRAADAFYVWVAAREELVLVTADREISSRAPLVGVEVVAP
jgi:predicted nucleic acid-binding protein